MTDNLVMKTKEEIEKTIEAIKTRQFYLAMKDYWSGADFEQDRKFSADIKALEKELEELK